MKTYILTAKLKINEQTIRQARLWEKRRKLKYGDNTAHLVMDYISSGEIVDYENESIEMEEYNEPKCNHKKIVSKA